MAIPDINPQPASGFRAIDLNSCEPKCKCFWGENKGKAYYRDQPCVAKDGFDEDTCTCPFYPSGVFFSIQYPAVDNCYTEKISASCCCGYYGVNLGGADPCGNAYTIECYDCICPKELTACKDGCVERLRINSPGVITSYKKPVVVNKAGEKECTTTCPPINAGCGYRKTWNSLLGTNAKYVVIRVSYSPFYRLIDATTTDGVVDGAADCCPQTVFTNIYGNCEVPETEYPTCDWSTSSGGVPQNYGIANSVMMEAKVLLGGEEVDVVFLVAGLLGEGLNGRSSSCFKFIAAELRLSNGLGGSKTEFISGSPEAIEAAQRRGRCGAVDCPGGQSCPENKEDCPVAATTCQGTIRRWWGEIIGYYWRKTAWQGNCGAGSI